MLFIDDLVKVFPGRKGSGGEPVVAVNSIRLEVGEGEMFTLLGPSGCGKTTTLRGVAGLEDPTSGRIRIHDNVLFDSENFVNVPPSKRGLGMVFQSYAIWPHMNVFKNVAYPLTVLPRRKRLSRKLIEERVERVLETVQLGHLLTRPATDLSGGQQQRLALARALVMEPPLLLLDEPLSNLDAKLREKMRFELKRLQRDLGITAIYVTHDQVEALTMSSTIAVMQNGNVEQVGRPREIYNNPSSRFVADFIGTSNFFDGVVNSREPGGDYLIDTTEGPLVVPSAIDLPVGQRVTVCVRPEHVTVVEDASDRGTTPNVFRGEVIARGFMGESVEHELLIGKIGIRARCNPSVSIPSGSVVAVELPKSWCSLIPEHD
jgi:iron(III) transport system ATP-binding protein